MNAPVPANACARTPSPRAGFSLLELLVVASILAVVVAAVAACLSGGLRVWDAAQHVGRVEAAGLMAMESLCGELRNTFAFQAIGFRGDPNAIAFPGVIVTDDPDEGLQRRLGTIRYGYDSTGLLREVVPYPEGAPVRERLAADVAELRFIFRTVDGGIVEGSTNLPAAVDVALVLIDKDSGETVTLERQVPVTAGSIE